MSDVATIASLTAAERKALMAMPQWEHVAARRNSPFNGRVMWSLCEKGYIGTPCRTDKPTMYARTSRGREVQA